MKAAFHTLGCKVNQYETEAMKEQFKAAGFEITGEEDFADVYVINTCTVTNLADRKSRQYIRRMKKKNPEAVVAVTGCYAQVKPEEVSALEEVNIVAGTGEKNNIVRYVQEFLDLRENQQHIRAYDELINYDDRGIITSMESRTRAYIKIQDGCNQFCSYCVIPYARGRVRSRKEEDIIKEVKGLVTAGYREIVVTGIHLSSYGLDFINKESGDYLQGVDIRTQAYRKGYLLDILEKINAIEGLERIRIGSLEPRIITEEFASRLKKLDKLCPHFHLSLQSGCDATLKRMNRHYSADEFKEKVEILRNIFENPAITTDVIVGFPGETEEEFAATYEFIKDIRFYEMHVFKYSKRQGTVAAARTDQIDDRIKTKRSNQLLEMEQKQSADYRAGYLGKTVEALLEEEKVIRGKKYQVGYTRNYVKVAIETAENLSNCIVEGKAAALLDNEYLLIEKS